MQRQKINGDTRYTSRILKLDTAYVESICANYSGDNLIYKSEKILTNYYPKAELTCPLCHSGNKRRHNRPATLIPTEVGYLFKCLACMENVGAISLHNLLQKINPQVAEDYVWDRWENKTTAFYGFSCPDPPKNAKAEYYKQKEQELKEKNKREYERKHGLTEN